MVRLKILVAITVIYAFYVKQSVTLEPRCPDNQYKTYEIERKPKLFLKFEPMDKRNIGPTSYKINKVGSEIEENISVLENLANSDAELCVKFQYYDKDIIYNSLSSYEKIIYELDLQPRYIVWLGLSGMLCVLLVLIVVNCKLYKSLKELDKLPLEPRGPNYVMTSSEMGEYDYSQPVNIQRSENHYTHKRTVNGNPLMGSLDKRKKTPANLYAD